MHLSENVYAIWQTLSEDKPIDFIRYKCAVCPPSPQRISSVFVRLEVFPKALYFHHQEEADWYAMFFTDIAEMVPLSEACMTQAHLEAEQAGLDALDALHIAAAKLGGAEEFVITECLTTALFRVVGLQMTTIRPTRL